MRTTNKLYASLYRATKPKKTLEDYLAQVCAELVIWQALVLICWVGVYQLVKPAGYTQCLLPGLALRGLLWLGDWVHRRIAGNAVRLLLLGVLAAALVMWVVNRI